MPDLCFTKDWRLKACSVRSMVSVFSNVLKCEDLAYVEINNYCMRHWFYRRVFPSSGQRQFCRHTHRERERSNPHTHRERERSTPHTHKQTQRERESGPHTHRERSNPHREREREAQSTHTGPLHTHKHKEIERAVHTHTHTHTQSRHEWISAPGRHFDFYSLNGTNHMKICNALCCAQH